MKGLLFTYLATYGGAVAALFNPLIGFYAYVAFSILRPESLWAWSVPPGNYSRTLAIAMLVGWTARGFGSWKLGAGWIVAGSLLGYWGWAAAAAVAADHQAVAWGFMEALTKIVVPFLVGATLMRSLADIKRFVWVIVLSQGYVAFEMNLRYVLGFNQAAEMGFGSMGRASFAVGLVASIGAAAFLIAAAERWWAKLVALACALLILHTVILTFSRGGLLALAISGAAAFIVAPKRPVHYLALAVLLVVAVRLTGAEVTTRFMTTFAEAGERDFSAQSRIDLWADCWQIMRENPVLGIGPDHWPIVAPRFGWPPGKEAHSLWLQTGAELGFPGALLLIAFYGSAILLILPKRRLRGSAEAQWLSACSCMVVTAIVGFAVAAQAVTLEGLELPYYLALITVATSRPGFAAEALAPGLSPRPADAHAPEVISWQPRSSF